MFGFGTKSSELEKMMEWERFRKPGETFNYMGIKMIVVRYGTPAGDTEPKLFCRYSDRHWCLHHYSFAYYELPILREMNP